MPNFSVARPILFIVAMICPFGFSIDRPCIGLSSSFGKLIADAEHDWIYQADRAKTLRQLSKCLNAIGTKSNDLSRFANLFRHLSEQSTSPADLRAEANLGYSAIGKLPGSLDLICSTANIDLKLNNTQAAEKLMTLACSMENLPGVSQIEKRRRNRCSAELASALAKLVRWQQVRDVCKTVKLLDENKSAAKLLIRAHLELGDLSSARKTCLQVMKRFPDDGDLYQLNIEISGRLRDKYSAQRDLDILKEMREANTLISRAEAELETNEAADLLGGSYGNLRKSRILISQALQAKHLSDGSLRKICVTLLQMNALKDAESVVERCLRLEPMDFENIMLAGKIKQRLGKHLEAESFFQQALDGSLKEHGPSFAGKVEYLARSQVNNHRYAEAVKTVARLRFDVSSAPELRSRPLKWAAIAHERMNQVQLAVNDYAEAIRICPHEAEWFRNRAALLKRMGKSTLAAKDLASAAKLDYQPPVGLGKPLE